MTLRRSHHADKMAKLYDQSISPLWSRHFGKLLMRHLRLPPKSTVLDVGCGTGYPSLEILQRLDAQSRIIAIDASSPMLDEARQKAGAASGKRIFFRSESAIPRLSFAADVYDLVVSNAGLHEIDDPEGAIREFARVAKENGRVVVTLPLAGTFEEFFDIFREMLVKSDRSEALDRLDAYLTRFPPLEQAVAWFEDAGLVDVEAEFDTYRLLFKSAREFFFAPVIEYGPLTDWKAVAGKGREMQDIFLDVKNAIDAYFGGSSFPVTVMAGCVRGRKPRAGEVEHDRLGLAVTDHPEDADAEELHTGDVLLEDAADLEITPSVRRNLGVPEPVGRRPQDGDDDGEDDDSEDDGEDSGPLF